MFDLGALHIEAADGSTARRSELMRNVASLFALTSERCSPEQIDLYDSVLLKLADIVEVEARAAVAETLAHLRRAPERTVRHLAHDEIAVSWPILVHSPVLTDVDLIELLGVSLAHLDAIAGREFLSERVTDRIVMVDSLSALVKVAANPGARLTEAGFLRLAERAAADNAIAEGLVNRPDTPDAIIRRLADLIGEALSDRLQALGTPAPRDMIDAASRLASERMTNDYWLSLYDFESAFARLERLGGQRIANEHLLLCFAEDDRFSEAAACFALMTNIPLQEAARCLVASDTDDFLLLARGLGLTGKTVRTMLKAGPWKHRLTPEARRAASDRFERSEQGNATIARWGKPLRTATMQ